MAQSPGPEDGSIAQEIAALQPRLVGFARALTSDPEVAADLAQEAVLRALSSQWRFTPGTNLKAWLFRILRNLYLNRQRSAAARTRTVRFDELDLGETLTNSSNPVEHAVVLKAELVEVLKAFRSLPAIYAAPLHLTAIEELTYAETASVLGVPVGTVMSRVYRGRRLLLARLEGKTR
jgi:RNA polymerase sigma-70 factor (ECF subfamily)